MKKAHIFIAVIVLFIGYNILLLIFSDSISNDVIYSSTQPDKISYNSFDPYTMTITEGRVQWRQLGWPRSKIIKITHENDSTYGYMIELTMVGTNFTKTKTIWNNKGINIIFSNGHNLMLPKHSFIGGR